MILSILGTIVFGAVIGALARLVVPGKQNISLLATVIIGIVGALIGYWIWGGPANDNSIDVKRWITSIAAAVLLVLAYVAIAGRRSGPRV